MEEDDKKKTQTSALSPTGRTPARPAMQYLHTESGQKSGLGFPGGLPNKNHDIIYGMGRQNGKSFMRKIVQHLHNESVCPVLLAPRSPDLTAFHKDMVKPIRDPGYILTDEVSDANKRGVVLVDLERRILTDVDGVFADIPKEKLDKMLTVMKEGTDEYLYGALIGQAPFSMGDIIPITPPDRHMSLEMFKGFVKEPMPELKEEPDNPHEDCYGGADYSRPPEMSVWDHDMKRARNKAERKRKKKARKKHNK
jgi:hypothetical protein